VLKCSSLRRQRLVPDAWHGALPRHRHRRRLRTHAGEVEASQATAAKNHWLQVRGQRSPGKYGVRATWSSPAEMQQVRHPQRSVGSRSGCYLPQSASFICAEMLELRKSSMVAMLRVPLSRLWQEVMRKWQPPVVESCLLTRTPLCTPQKLWAANKPPSALSAAINDVSPLVAIPVFRMRTELLGWSP
jgi:hypothetical protein